MKIKILLGALMAVFFTACSSDATSESEKQLTRLMNDRIYEGTAYTFNLKDSKIVFQNDSLTVLHTFIYTKINGQEYGEPIEYACVKSSDGKKYEVALLTSQKGITQYIIPENLNADSIKTEDSELIINNTLKMLNKYGRIADSDQPIPLNRFTPVLKTGFWELGKAPYPESNLTKGLYYDPNAVYMILTDKNSGKGVSIPDFVDNKLVLIITKDNLDALKKNRSESEFIELITSPDFPQLYPEYQDPHRVSFRINDAITDDLKRGGYCDLNVIKSNGDTCYTTNSRMFYYKWSDKWSKPNGYEGDGNFVAPFSQSLLNELYKEDCFKIQVILYDRMCGQNGVMEFFCDTHGLNEALKQL